ncbi:hypothetical protein SAMN04487934_11817 [Eubacterium ruminantium]|nr:hypothetical protein SAMN04487934_11817 [Eubacterium ruminantium]
MGKYFVNDIKCGISNGGIACGPIEGAINVSIKITEDNRTFWLTNSEYTGIPNFYITDDDIFDKLMNDIDNDFIEYLSDKNITEFEGISLGDYDEIFESIKNNSNNPASFLIRYIILLTRSSTDNSDKIISLSKGKYIDTIDFPESDLEEHYRINNTLN